MTYVFEDVDEASAQRLIVKVRKPIFAFQTWQVIDRSRDIVLADLGGDGSDPSRAREVPSHFNLLWTGMPIAFACWNSKTYTANSVFVEVDIEKIEVPFSLQPLLDEIKQAIWETLEVYWGGRKERIAKVHINFPDISFY